MNKGKQLILLVVGAVVPLLAACTDELVVQGTPTGRFTPQGELVEASLDLAVTTLSVVPNTRAVDDSEAERRVNDFWLFQYDFATGDLITAPVYYTVEEQTAVADMSVRLSDNDGKACVVYVVANTGDDTWAADAQGNYDGFNYLDKLETQTIPNPAPIRMESSGDASGTDDDGNEGDGTDGTDSTDSTDDDGTDNGTDEAHLSIPMGGCVGEDGTLVVYRDEEIKVPLERMFAKLEVYVTLTASEDYGEPVMTSLAIDKILNACSVAATTDDDGAWVQPENSKFEVTRTFNNPVADSDGRYGPFILYVPENRSSDKADAIKLIPYIKATDRSSGADILSKPYYTAYPGSWSSSIRSGGDNGAGENYEIRRNCVYAISITVNMEEEPVTPSANCLIATPGRTIAFYPYVRDEQMSGELMAEADEEIINRYTFTNYLNPSYVGDDATGGKKIKSVKIIWQTEDCIGNNSDGDLVWIDDAPDEGDYAGMGDEEIATAMTEAEGRRKIYVTVKDYGNALIAAYDGEEGTGNILWSWHIWVPQVDPEADAIEYYHYAWDAVNGIDISTFVPGRLVMNMNLGALVEKPENRYTHDTNTFGMLYQWGRKDPFPPVKMTVEGTPLYWQIYGFDYQYADCTFTRSQNGFNPTYTIKIGVYDNEDKKIDLTDNYGSINAPGGTDVFYTDMPNTVTTQVDGSGEYYTGTLDATDDNTVIRSTVQHPTMFIAARAPSSWNIEIGTGDYYNEGDWLPVSDNFLWGGTDPNAVEYPVYTGSFTADLEDNYGSEKTIFDPCPYGWRVAPGDLWLGFTKDGKNWHYNPDDGDSGLNHLDEINIDREETGETIFAQHGFNMYMQGWQGAMGSATSFFPNQGIRSASGQPFGDISCGNYHNATVDKVINNIRRVNIIHFHCNNSYYSNSDGNNVFIKVFVDDTFFYEKALGCPLRCVRDTK